MSSAALLVLAAALAGLALLVLRGRHTNPVNRSFALFTASLAGWVLGIGALYGGFWPDAWGRFTFAAACVVPAAFLSFAWVYPAPSNWPRLEIRRAVWAAGLAAMLTSATTRLVAHTHGGLGAAGLTRESGPLYPLFALYFLATAVTGLAVFITKWRRARGLARVQLQYLGIGLVIAATGGVTANLLVPLITGQSRYSALGPYCLLPLVLLVSHAIIRHRLLDLRVVIRRSVAFTVVIGAVSAAIWILLMLMLGGPADEVPVPVEVLILLGAAAICLSAPVAPRLARVIDSYLLRGRPDLDRALQEGARRLSRFLTVEEITAELRRLLNSTLVPEALVITTETPDHGPEAAAGNSRPTGQPADDRIATAAWAVQGALPAVHLLGAVPTAAEGVSDAETTLRDAGFEVWVGLGRGGQRFGVVLLGPRGGGQAYVAPALTFLEDLAEVASMALETAILHRQQLALQRESERLAHLARMGRMYASLAHEVRNPLATISNLVSLLGDRLGDPDYRDLVARVVPAEVSRIVKLSERLRALSPDTVGPSRPVELATILADIVSMLSPVADRQGVTLLLDAAADVPAVAGDPDQLVPLFQNLLRNAMDATAAGGRILVRAEREGSRARVRVIDEGPGLDAGFSLFEPFVTTKTAGLGLGLSICRELAEAHGAQLTLRNRGDRRGAIAEIVFPEAADRVTPA